MNLTVVKEFLKSKKGITVIAGVIGAGIIHFFPESKDLIAQLLNGIADKIQSVQ